MSTSHGILSLPVNSCHGLLTIDGIAMQTPAWTVANLFDLWQPSDVEGTDVKIPAMSGSIPYPRRRIASTRSLQMIVVGTVTRLGAVNADPIIGLEVNLKYLRDNVIAPVSSSTGTRTASLTMPSGAVRTGPVHVQTFKTTIGVTDTCTAVLDLSLPYGELV